ncbi:MAG TPA: hypothetical protein VHX87_04950 [Galbitalea sp.]|jgi:hypothetical protein|nr:hypothetical protein [Galbitalea sp.]
MLEPVDFAATALCTALPVETFDAVDAFADALVDALVDVLVDVLAPGVDDSETLIGIPASDGVVTGALLATKLMPLAVEPGTLMVVPPAWTRRTAPTSATPINATCFNVCTPIQRLHRPPTETGA